MKIKDLIKKNIILNYIRNKGKVVDKSVMGMVLKEDSEAKKDIKSLLNSINEEIKLFESKSDKEKINEIKFVKPDYNPNAKEDLKDNKRDEMIQVPGLIKGKVITRMAPEPSKYNHFGHALSFLMNYKYAKDYDGKSFLRFEDTNPLNATKEFVESMKEDLINYLGINPDEIIYVSDHMDLFYSHAETLIKKGHAYMDFSTGDEIKDQRANLTPSNYRDVDVKTNMNEWKKFIAGDYEPGSCILRLRIEPDHSNEVMRDPVLFRIIKEKHWRHKNKYCAWPLYDFENAIEDGSMKITHVFRSNEFGKQRIELQDYIRSLLKLNNPLVIQYGRFNIKGGVSKGRDIREMIESKEYTGWDDPRLITLKALKRRGIKPEAFVKLLSQVGLSPTPTNLDFRTLSAINRQILDPICEKLFYVDEPVLIHIKDAPELKINFDSKKLNRMFHTNDKFYITKKDYDSFKNGQIVRLIDTLNFKIKKTKTDVLFSYHSTDFESYLKEKNKAGKIHYCVPDQIIEVNMINEDATETNGVIEKAALNMKKDQIIQGERFGFIRLEIKNKNNQLQFVYCHK